jgi:hypothetical protein
MRLWPFRRRIRHFDQIGPATLYPNRSGALAPEAVPNGSRNVGHHWATEPTSEYQRAPLLTLGQGYRAGGWRNA